MLKSVAELRALGDLQAINLVPYARTVGLELLRDDEGLLAALRFREGNIGISSPARFMAALSAGSSSTRR